MAAAGAAFADAMSSTLLVGAAIAMMGALLALVFIPGKRAQVLAEVATARDRPATCNERKRMPAGRPRDRAVDARILAAVYQLLLTTRISDVTMDAVTAEAGVGKPTIYRRWSSKDELVIDALATHAPRAESVVGGVERDDLVTIVEHLMLAPDVGGRHLLAMFDHATGDPKLARALWEGVLRPRHDEIGRMLEEAKAAGKVRADADLETTVALVLGATLAAGVLKAIGGDSAAPEDNAHVAAERIVDCLWLGLKGASE